MSPAALDELAAVVDDYVDREMVVGAELLVIKDRQTVLHEAFGLRDREADLPMERDTLFNIRSMTKPVTGAAVQVLIDDGTLRLDDRAADFLPCFDTDAAREITVEQLQKAGVDLTDPATGLFSEGYFRVALDARLSAARRHLRPVPTHLGDLPVVGRENHVLGLDPGGLGGGAALHGEDDRAHRLVEAGVSGCILPDLPQDLAESAERTLEKKGVTVLYNTRIEACR
mgnify:CR=1 FL=1